VKPDTQKAAILFHVKQRRPITALEALKRYGCFRLAARVYELRADGHPIIQRMREIRGKRVAEYRLVS
jgi:hypothetical protein